MAICLSGIQHIRPRYEIDQDAVLEWLATAHSEAASSPGVYEEVLSKFAKIRGGSDPILKRGFQLKDMAGTDWEEMEIYPVKRMPEGQGFKERSRYYDLEATRVFEQFYPVGSPLPSHLIHVTCTGYVSPSPAQRLVSMRNGGESTTVTHAYHMGCYGALAGVRIGRGLASTSSVDIVHTEMASLHFHPQRRTLDQLVVQSLFADGFIKYSLSAEGSGEPYLKILALHEEILPGSEEHLTWRCEDHGLGMTLSKEVPVVIARSLRKYLERLSRRANQAVEALLQEAYFAVHPGGAKILQYAKESLQLRDAQMAHSQGVLADYGNMSSATLPHVWERMLPEIPSGALVVSLAFGPGMCISGALFQRG